MTDNERLAVLETKFKNLEDNLLRMTSQVDEIHAILLQARGVRWAVLSAAGVVGFIVGAIIKMGYTLHG